MEYIEDFSKLKDFTLYFFKFKPLTERFHFHKDNRIKNRSYNYRVGVKVNDSIYFLNSFLLEESSKKDRGIRELISKNILNNFGAVLYLRDEKICKNFQNNFGNDNFLKDYFLLGYVWKILNLNDVNLIKNVEYAIIYDDFILDQNKKDNYIYDIYHKKIYNKIISNLRYKL